MIPLDFETTINIEGDDVDVILTGNYIEKTICNSHAGFYEYEGDEIEDMKVLCPNGPANVIDLTPVIPDDVLEKLNRRFSDAVKTGKI
jgi:hypothetical protein